MSTNVSKAPLILRLTSGKLNHFAVGFIFLLLLAIVWRLVIYMEGWSISNKSLNLAVFFSVTISYTIIITRVIINGHLKDFDQIKLLTNLSKDKLCELRHTLQHQGSLGKLTLIAGFVGLLHSAIGSGPFYDLLTLTPRYLYFDIWMTLLIAGIWMVITQACAIFVRNLKLFAKITEHVNIDLLNIEDLTVFLKTGVRSTLAFIGTYALFPLIGLPNFKDMFLNPAIFIFIPLIMVMILIPLLPLRKKIKHAKDLELELINKAIKGDKESLRHSHISSDLKNINIIDLIAYKKIIIGIKEIPFNIPIAFRLLLYIIIPLLTWVAASLVDKIVVAILNF